MTRWLLAFCLLVLGGIGYLVWVAKRIEGQTALFQEVKMTTTTSNEPATATWTSGGLTITVTTELDNSTTPPETIAAWAARHRARVTAMLEQFPKDA